MEKKSSLIKIAIVGPESTGKSWLSEQLASHYHTLQVPEYARQFIEKLDRPYKESDLLDIAKGQVALELEISKQCNEILICDTNLIVIKIWSEFKYNTLNPWIETKLKERQYTLHLLCNTDLRWEHDEQREHPHLREELFELYHDYLQKNEIPFSIVTGEGKERLNNAIEAISNYLKSNNEIDKK